MSDSVQDLVRNYEENVLDGGYPRSIGLFPIPEYPEFESGHGMWSAALDTVLTTLRYLAPATLLTLFWGQQSFLFKLLKYIDSAFRAIVFTSEEQKQQVLQWLAEAGPVQVEHMETVWRHGWIVCGVLDAALPGACAGHPPTRLSLKHAQAIADHYLGVEPVFSRQELESNDSLSRHQEWKLASYLDRIREALSKLTPPVSKPTSQRTLLETTQFTLDYVSKGSGLSAAQINNKMYFKIYPASQQSLDPGEITVLIKGPKDTYGMTILPPVLGKAQKIRQKVLGLLSKSNYTENALPLTQGATYLRAYGKHDMNKTYYIPKIKYDIEIQEEIRKDYIKVGYVVSLEGNYEISITSRGQNIVGSPFTMKASKNIINTLERDSSCLEDGEEIDILDVKNDRKVVLRIVDFVTEKMLLNENGSLEKINEDEATSLMTTNSLFEDTVDSFVTPTTSDKIKSLRFFRAASKIIQINRVCKVLKTIMKKNRKVSIKESCYLPSRSQQDIPDIVNSTFGDTTLNPFILSDKRDQVIIPESISVTLRTEKSKTFCEEMKQLKREIKEDIDIEDSVLHKQVKSYKAYNLEMSEILPEDDIIISRAILSSNPFSNDIYEQTFEKALGTFVKTEYETNNSQDEETEDTTIKIIVDAAEGNTPSPVVSYPFIEPDVINMERPKTPVLKIITGEITDASVYVDPKTTPEQIFANEFTNPFFLLHHQTDEEESLVTDFIIGAPVSLPPIIRSQTPEPLLTSCTIENPVNMGTVYEDISSPIFSTPGHTPAKSKGIHKNSINISQSLSTFHSLDFTENVDKVNMPNTDDIHKVIESERNMSPKKELWDSAYVSIDENNTCPDSNNNENNSCYGTPTKQKISLSNNNQDFTKMGPAEREIWQTYMRINDVAKTNDDEIPRWDVKRSTFTPIIEENNRSMSVELKHFPMSDQFFKLLDADTVAFTEPSKNKEPAAMFAKDFVTKVERVKGVDSASAKSDVMRHEKNKEGKISEVQENVTESVSVSHALQIQEQSCLCTDVTKDETQFGDEKYTNIVLEKKQYWDEKIRQIQAKDAEDTSPKKRKLTARHLRQNDSLTKQRGKQLAKTYFKDNKASQYKTTEELEVINRKSPISADSAKNVKTDVKLVHKWKQYWDTKLESEKEELDYHCFQTKSHKRLNSIISPQVKSSDDETEVSKPSKNVKSKAFTPPVKQELPEEVYKAFETSPKRFFGTSRKQIFNKIDIFLGKTSTADESSADESGASPDTGLVSSRISMFHNISKTEQLPSSRRKFQSMHNIFQGKDSVRNDSIDGNVKTRYLVRAASLVLENPNGTEVINSKIASAAILETPNSQPKQYDNVTLNDKRARFAQKACTFEAVSQKTPNQDKGAMVNISVQNSINQYNKKCYTNIPERFKPNILRKSSVSKSEMDIFNKTSFKRPNNDLDMHKSCDELPEANVRNFISLYESVSKPDLQTPLKNTSRKSLDGQKRLTSSLSLEAANKIHSSSTNYTTPILKSEIQHVDDKIDNIRLLSFWEKANQQSISMSSLTSKSFDSVEVGIASSEETTKKYGSFNINNSSAEEGTYISLSDIEVEIVDKSDQTAPLKSDAGSDYKSRFKLAKQFFQSLEELGDEVKPKKPNECELLLMNTSSESLEIEKPKKRVKKNIKARSVSSSELSEVLNRLRDTASNTNQLVKISEKFNVDDLFNDVTEGKLSRQGSLRGIPHKKAVLETFRSMENLKASNMSSYEIAISQLNDFAKENSIKNVQTYLTEYPYLPKTDPSKYHSRMDVKASGLISLKELQNQKPRRNSVPDLWLNTKFIVDL